MKNVIIVVVLLVVGYFAYQHFMPVETEEEEDEIVESLSADQIPDVPGNCSRLAKQYENAVYGVGTGRASQSQLASSSRKFKSCLDDAGLSEAEMNGILAQRREIANKKLKMDGYR